MLLHRLLAHLLNRLLIFLQVEVDPETILSLFRCFEVPILAENVADFERAHLVLCLNVDATLCECLQMVLFTLRQDESVDRLLEGVAFDTIA